MDATPKMLLLGQKPEKDTNGDYDNAYDGDTNSNKTSHEANQSYIPSDDSFVHNFRACVQTLT